MSVKGFGRHPNGKAHPVHEKKGVDEKSFSVTEKGMNDKIEVKIVPRTKSNDRQKMLKDITIVPRLSDWARDRLGKHGTTKNIWDDMTEVQRKEYLKEIGLTSYYADTKLDNIPYTVRSMIIFGIDLGKNIDKNWDHYEVPSKKSIIGEAYHGQLSSELVNELANSKWSDIPELYQNELISYLNYGTLES